MATFNRFIDRDFNEIFTFFRKNYLTFLITGFILIAFTFVFNQISVPKYKITSQVLIKQDDPNQNKNMGNVLSFNILGDNTNFNNELVKIKSIPFIEKVIENLNLQLTYYEKNTFRYSELYNDAPVTVNYTGAQHHFEHPADFHPMAEDDPVRVETGLFLCGRAAQVQGAVRVAHLPDRRTRLRAASH